jgi:hypothetical protein
LRAKSSRVFPRCELLMIVAMWTHTAATRSGRDVRFTPESGHGGHPQARQLRTINRHRRAITHVRFMAKAIRRYRFAVKAFQAASESI